MLKQGAFINKKFNKLVLGNIWCWIAYTANMMADSIISGNQLGEASLQAVTIVYPLYNVVTFFSIFVSAGSSVIFGKLIGEFKKDDADRVAGTSIMSSFVIGVLLALSLWLIKEPFLIYYKCSGELLFEASSYYNWMILYSLLLPVYNTLYYLAATDGEAAILSLGEVTNILINIFLSVTFSHFMGIGGLGLATCLGIFSAIIIFSLHFLKKSNNVHIKFCLDMHIVKKSIKLGFNRYIIYIFMAIVDVVMNKIVINTCGITFIPVYSVINLVFGVCECFASLNDAGVGLITCFWGEKNNHDMSLIFKKIGFSMVIMAAVISALFFFGAPLIPAIYGLETQEVILASIKTSRIMAFSVLGFGACYLSAEISCLVEKPLQAGFICLLYSALSPLLLSLILGSVFKFTGIVIGMCLSTYFSFGFYALVSLIRNGKKGFPIYPKNFGEEGVSFDFMVSIENVTKIRDAINLELTSRSFDIDNIDLLMEEFFTRVIEKNEGKAVLAECTLLFSEERVRIFIRNEGILFNFVDENSRIESLNAHVLNSLLELTNEKNYLLTTSFNRNGFAFNKRKEEI